LEQAMAPRQERPGLDVRALLLGERIDARAVTLPGFEQVMQAPRVFQRGEDAFVAVFRFGAVVIAQQPGARPEDLATAIGRYVAGPFNPVESETATLTLDPGGDDKVAAPGLVALGDFSVDRFAVVADVLAQSVVLARGERLIEGVFERLEPFARELAVSGGRALSSHLPLRLLGDALLAQHRLVGRVEAGDKPDILWDRPDLQRLYLRLDEEFEIGERSRALARKLKVVEEGASVIADVADTYFNRRLEVAIIALIGVEIALSLATLFFGHL
jgi:uncharacterized Rmd1/YagE family protein